MKRSLRSAAAAAVLAYGLASQAQAAVIGFDDLSHDAIIPAGYQDLGWSNLRVADPWAPGEGLEDSGYAHGVTSPSYVAYNRFGEPAAIHALSGVFSFNGGQFTAAWRDDLQLRIDGYSGADLLYTTTLDLNTTGPFALAADWQGLTRLDFTSFVPGGGDFSSHFALDDLNITVSAVPEPATWAMLITGFALAGSALRARRRVVGVAG